MEFYSVIRNNDKCFEGKWMQLEDVMLSEVSQAQKHKGCIFSLIRGRCMIFLMCCWTLLASILFMVFASIFIRDIGQLLPFFDAVLSGFGIVVILVL
jgi:hypothetical protein